MRSLIVLAALTAFCHGLKLAQVDFAKPKETTSATDEKKDKEKAADKDTKDKDSKDKAADKGTKDSKDKDSKGKDKTKFILPRGHFYNAKKCSDCDYKADQCGCGPVMEYLACVTKHCHKTTEKHFFDKCVAIENECSEDLEISCQADATCNGKFNQLPMGGLGFTMKTEGTTKDAFCGPTGKCIGTIHMAVDIHKSDSGKIKNGLWLECGIPKDAEGDMSKKANWARCFAEVGDKDDTASCDIPMFPELGTEAAAKGYCVLSDGKDGQLLTKPGYQSFTNAHPLH